MTQYEAPLLHSSQDMMQELFEEINDYLGDKDKPVLASPTSPVLSPFNVSTEGEEDEHSIEHTQDENNAMVDQNETLYQTEAPLQPAMFVESDDEDSCTYHGDTRDSIHIEHDQSGQVVCRCYKCKNDQAEYSGQQQTNENTNYDKSASTASKLLPFKRQSKPTSSFGGAVGNAKLAHIAGLVKQTLTSTPRDILPTTTTALKRPNNSRRPSALSTSSTSEKSVSPFTSLATSSSTTSRHSYIENKDEDAHSPSLGLSYKDNSRSENDISYGNDNNFGGTLDGNIGYQDINGNWMMMTAATPDDLAPSTNWDTSISQDTQNQTETGLYNEQGMDNTTQIGATTTPVYLDSYPEEKQQLPDDFSLTQQLPFLTPIHRIGEPHSIVLRTKLARDVGSHEDRINAYNNAYSHCIMARTDMVPWIKKQYSKGPPNLVLQYTPRPKKSSKSLFGLFKRHLKLDDTLPSTSLTANYNANPSKLSVSSARSSVFTDPPISVSPQPSFTPSESYFPQELQQPQQPILQPANDATSYVLPTASPSNDKDPHSADSTGSKTNKNILNHKSHEHHRRSLSPSRSMASGKKKSKSSASVAEPVSILKKSSSMANVTDGSGGSILKKSSSTTSFGDEELSTGYQNKSSASTFGTHGDDPFASNLKKSRSPSPNPSVESRRQSSRQRSPSPISYVPTATNTNHSHSKRSQLLCPPDNRPPTRQRSRSVSPSPRPSPSQRSRSLSPMAPPIRRSSLLEEYSEAPHHYRQQSSSDYRRSPSPLRTTPNRQYTAPPERHLSPRRYTSDNYKGHHRSSSHSSSTGSHHHNEQMGRKIHRTRSTELYDHYSPRYAATPSPPIDILDDDSAIVMMMDRRSRRSSYRSPSPLHYDDEESSYLLPLEQQHLPRRLSSHRRMRSVSPNHPPPPPPLVSTGRRATDPPNINLRHRDRAPMQRRRSMVMEEEQLEEDTTRGGGQYYCGNDRYVSQKQQPIRGSNHAKRRPSSSHQPPLGKQQQNISAAAQHQHHDAALHDLCAFFQHLPRHVLANYLEDAGGDFFLAKDLCMEDIMANGI